MVFFLNATVLYHFVHIIKDINNTITIQSVQLSFLCHIPFFRLTLKLRNSEKLALLCIFTIYKMTVPGIVL